MSIHLSKGYLRSIPVCFKKNSKLLKVLKPRPSYPTTNYPLSYALRDKVEKKFDCFQLQGVITFVLFSDWAAPIVPVAKTDGTIHVCGDYTVTVNAESKLDAYPIPYVGDSLSGG